MRHSRFLIMWKASIECIVKSTDNRKWISQAPIHLFGLVHTTNEICGMQLHFAIICQLKRESSRDIANTTFFTLLLDSVHHCIYICKCSYKYKVYTAAYYPFIPVLQSSSAIQRWGRKATKKRIPFTFRFVNCEL